MQSIPVSGLPIAPAVILPTDMLMMCRDGVTLEKVPYSQVAQALGQMYWGSLGAFTTTTASFTQPASAGTVAVSVVATAWMSAGQFITVASGGLYQVSSITNSTTVVLLNTGWTGNATASTVIPASSAVAVGGAVGSTGSTGANGTNGVNAYTTLTASFTQPAALSTVNAAVASSAWMVVGMQLYIGTGGYYTLTSISSLTLITLTNSGTSGNASPGATVANTSVVAPAGYPGSSGLPAQASPQNGLALITNGSSASWGQSAAEALGVIAFLGS